MHPILHKEHRFKLRRLQLLKTQARHTIDDQLSIQASNASHRPHQINWQIITWETCLTAVIQPPDRDIRASITRIGQVC